MNQHEIDNLDLSAGDIVYSTEGWCAGPTIGVVYQLGPDEGWIGARGSTQVPGATSRKWFKSLAKAKNYAVRMTYQKHP